MGHASPTIGTRVRKLTTCSYDYTWIRSVTAPAAFGAEGAARGEIFSPDPLLEHHDRADAGAEDIHLHAARCVGRQDGRELGAGPVLCGLAGGELGVVLARCWPQAAVCGGPRRPRGHWRLRRRTAAAASAP